MIHKVSGWKTARGAFFEKQSEALLQEGQDLIEDKAHHLIACDQIDINNNVRVSAEVIFNWLLGNQDVVRESLRRIDEANKIKEFENQKVCGRPNA